MQLRMAPHGPFALDYGAIMQVGAARGVDLALLSSALPHAEAAIISNLTEQDSSGDDLAGIGQQAPGENGGDDGGSERS